MSKNYEDISTYFVTSSKTKGNMDGNVSQSLTTDSLFTFNNNEVEIDNNKETSVNNPSCINRHSNTTDTLLIDDNDIGLHVSNKLTAKNFSLLYRLLNKLSIPSPTYVLPKVEKNE